MPRQRRGRRTRSRETPRDFHEHLVVADHGTERSLARRVLLGERELVPSRNDYDWLGHGVYFWELGLARALQFAEEKERRGVLRDPFAIGAYIRLGRCLDLTDTWATEALAISYLDYRHDVMKAGKTLPVNRPLAGQIAEAPLRHLDCAVINHCTKNADRDALRVGRSFGYDSVRGVFEEGARAFPGAALRSKSHIQIAVRNPACILGVFRPRGYSV